MRSCHEQHLFAVSILPVPQQQFVQSYVPCVLSPVSGEIWQGHKLHRQPQPPVRVMLALCFVCATHRSEFGNGIATVGYRHDEIQLHHRPVTGRLIGVRVVNCDGLVVTKADYLMGSVKGPDASVCPYIFRRYKY